MSFEETSYVTSRKQQAAETKKRIFAATMSLIEEKGFENVQIRDIQNRANIRSVALAKECNGYALSKRVFHRFILLSALECIAAIPKAAFFRCGKN